MLHCSMNKSNHVMSGEEKSGNLEHPFWLISGHQQSIPTISLSFITEYISLDSSAVTVILNRDLFPQTSYHTIILPNTTNTTHYQYRTLYVGLAHAAPPTQYKAFMAFSTNWLSEGSTSRYTCKEQQISRPGYLPSDCQHAKSSRRTEIAKNSIFL